MIEVDLTSISYKSTIIIEKTLESKKKKKKKNLAKLVLKDMLLLKYNSLF